MKKEKEALKSFKAIDTVNVPRSSGEVEPGWVIRYIYPDEETGKDTACVIDEERGLKKYLPLDILREYNP